MIWGSIVIPVLDQAAELGRCLASLQYLRAQGWKIIVVDGGSRDDSVGVANTGADVVLQAMPLRANLMNVGARAAEGEAVVFLHSDLMLPPSFVADMAAFMLADESWGRFDIAFASPKRRLRWLAGVINMQSRLSEVACGEQTLFFKRRFFHRLGGYPLTGFAEDILLSRKARLRSLCFCARARVIVSSNSCLVVSPLRASVMMLLLRLALMVRISPSLLSGLDFRRQ